VSSQVRKTRKSARRYEDVPRQRARSRHRGGKDAATILIAAHATPTVRLPPMRSDRHDRTAWLTLRGLCSEQLFPVCSPKLMYPHRQIRDFSLLRLDDWKNWTRWFEAAGVSDPIAHGPVLNRTSKLLPSTAKASHWRAPCWPHGTSQAVVSSGRSMCRWTCAALTGSLARRRRLD
jgi:hypothetical protein